MEEDLKFFINGIKDKTGLEIAMFNLDGLCIAGVSGSKETVNPDIKDIYLDVMSGRTLFPVNYKNKRYIGRIAGIGLAEQNYAKLITELAENYFFKETDLTSSEFYRAALLGELNYTQLKSNVRKYSIPELPCVAMIISAEANNTEDVIMVLENYNANSSDFLVKLDYNACALVRFIDEKNQEYRSAKEYAEFLAQSVYEETGIRLKIFIGGTVKSIFEINVSYSQAVSSQRLSRNASYSNGRIHTYKEYMLTKILEDLPKHKLNEYLSVLMDGNAGLIFGDEEMVTTAEGFLENNLNVSEASRELYVHRNTLMYRLDKIQKETGLDIRNFSDATIFRLISVLIKLIK